MTAIPSSIAGQIRALLHAAAQPMLGEAAMPDFSVERPRDKAHGDYATNLAMLLAKPLRQAPRTLAEKLQQALVQAPEFTAVEIAGPGFLNLRLTPGIYGTTLAAHRGWLAEGGSFAPQSGRYLVEFVSANPTGPLHVGHGRGAVVGDTLVRMLRRIGYQATAEYYINDAGLQIDILGRSVLARADQRDGQSVPFPEDGYKGDYIVDIARDWTAAGRVGGRDVPAVGRWAGEQIRQGIEADLRRLGVTFDTWFSELSLYADGSVQQCLDDLEARGHTRVEDDALWLATTRFGDDKDRVLRRGNGAYTYFTADIAYHRNKLGRGYTTLIDLWGADHHGYVPRVRAALDALGIDRQAVDILLIQFVSLLRDGQPVSMSTRAGTFETLADLIKAVGADATRFFYLLRKSDTPLDFDLGLATRQSNENPVYYVQYAHARCCALARKLGEGLEHADPAHWAQSEAAERELILTLDGWPETLQRATTERAPHLLVLYLQELAARFHKFYDQCSIGQADEPARSARLALVDWCRAVLADGLQVVGVSAPDSM